VISPLWVNKIVGVRSQARFLLVIEKDAVFTRLASSRFLDTFGPCIILTGRGYPDLATRALLKKLAAGLGPEVPLLALVDCDPDGVSIFLTYRTGGLHHKRSHEDLAVGNHLRWAGLHCRQLIGGGGQGLGRTLPLTLRDRKLLLSLLRSPDTAGIAGLRQELQLMMLLGMKAEIEALFGPQGDSNDSLIRGIVSDSDRWI